MALPQQQPSLDALSFSSPTEKREFPNGKVELVKLGGLNFGRATFQPGWRWSTDLKPIAGTESCQSSHLGVQLTGTMHIRMDDGTERDIRAGEVAQIPPGHDGWVVGNEPVVFIDITGMEHYAEQIKKAA
jgi:hypothetical protein